MKLQDGSFSPKQSGTAEGGAENGQDPIKRRVAPASWGRYPYGINIKDLRAPRAIIPIAKAIATYMFGFALIAGTTMLIHAGLIWTGILAAIVSACILALCYRGLECLVHGASHFDIHENAKVNDALADGLMALPVLQTVGSFRPRHLELHHSAFAYELDPCRVRMAQHVDVQRGDLPTLIETVKGLPREIREFYQTAGASPRTLTYGLLWHVAFLAAPIALLTGDIVAAAVAWFAIHIVTFFGTLPVVRAVAEAGEHDYAHLERAPTSQVERTFDNIGPLNSAIHPHGDKWHIEHHLFPGVPQYRLAEVHRRLIAKSLGNQMRYRDTLLGTPQPFSERAPAAAAEQLASERESIPPQPPSAAGNA